MTSIEVIVSTMNLASDDFSLIEKMNIQTDAIIINQTDHVAFQKQIINGNIIRIFSFDERGVGLSRNNGLMRSSADICLMADDDMVYVNGYEKIVLDAYRKNPDADFIVFNVRVHFKSHSNEMVKKNRRLRYWERFRYGTVSFTFRREAILKRNIFFSLLFGGGATYGSGEDTLFLWQTLRQKMRVYTNKGLIAEVYNDQSSWYKGFTTKYYSDKGALYKALSPKFNHLFNRYLLMKTYRDYDGEESVRDLLRVMKEGAASYTSK